MYCRDKAEARAAVAKDLGRAWNNAPESLEEWVGRKDLLKSITEDWVESKKRVTGLIGFGGEGKSSLVRRWVDELVWDEKLPQPDGIFWWGFYDRPNVDDFFEAALKYLSSGKIESYSANLRAQYIGAMIGAGRFLFILDGLEVLQYQEGDQYGSLKSQDIKAFLEFFGAPDHNSFCLVTSRAPLMELEDYTTYQHRDVDRLSFEDGRDLLRNLGVQGKEAELAKVVKDWDGHALTLTLLASYLRDNYAGDVAMMQNIPPPIAEEPRYERVRRVLRRYDEHLKEPERAFMRRFSAFRLPVDKDAFEYVFLAKPAKGGTLNTSLSHLDKEEFSGLVERLVLYRMLHREIQTGKYTIHPLIRAHYLSILTEDNAAEAKEVHRLIKDYYLIVSKDLPKNPSLENLRSLLEAVHHACCAKEYDAASNLVCKEINQDNNLILSHQLAAYDTILMLMSEFFPHGDLKKEPLVKNSYSRRWIYNTVGISLASLGHLREAISFYQRSEAIAFELEDWENASVTCMNLAELYSYLGDLESSLKASNQALYFSNLTEDKGDVPSSLYYKAWACHLRGELDSATSAFNEANAKMIEIVHHRRIFPTRSWHAIHLKRIGDLGLARRIIERDLDLNRNPWPAGLSQYKYILGDLEAENQQNDHAQKYYGEAITIGRSIAEREILIEALISRGKWAARYGKIIELAFNDLTEALGYAKDGNYRLYLVDTRIGLSWAHLAVGEKEKAKAEATYAKQMSEQMGYYWGKVDADEVLAEIAKQSEQ